MDQKHKEFFQKLQKLCLEYHFEIKSSFQVEEVVFLTTEHSDSGGTYAYYYYCNHFGESCNRLNLARLPLQRHWTEEINFMEQEDDNTEK